MAARVKVKYIGTAGSYTRGPYRWTKARPSVEVTQEVWEELKKVRMRYTGARQFILDDDGDDNDLSVRKAMAEAHVGDFLSKKDAQAFVRDMFEVEFEGGVELGVMNKISAELQRRYDAGLRDADLIRDFDVLRVAGAQAPAAEAAVEMDVAGEEIDTAVTAVAPKPVTKPTVRPVVAKPAQKPEIRQIG